MLVTDKEKYIDSLVGLWHNVFGDSEDYIKLFFKEAYFDAECFAEIVENETVSAFYLLNCTIKLDGKIYSGRYLYAAATLPQYRGKGYMSKLINEAIIYAKDKALDFIALVPASDSLYGYYGKFGFIESMYKYELRISKDEPPVKVFREITDYGEFNKIRNSADGNMLIYSDIVNKYAFDCLRFSGSRIYAVTNDSYYIENEEFFSADENFLHSAEALISGLHTDITVYSNCPLNSSLRIKNGMIRSFNSDFIPESIYMNIALD